MSSDNVNIATHMYITNDGYCRTKTVTGHDYLHVNVHVHVPCTCTHTLASTQTHSKAELKVNTTDLTTFSLFILRNGTKVKVTHVSTISYYTCTCTLYQYMYGVASEQMSGSKATADYLFDCVKLFSQNVTVHKNMFTNDQCADPKPRP